MISFTRIRTIAIPVLLLTAVPALGSGDLHAQTVSPNGIPTAPYIGARQQASTTISRVTSGMSPRIRAPRRNSRLRWNRRRCTPPCERLPIGNSRGRSRT